MNIYRSGTTILNCYLSCSKPFNTDTFIAQLRSGDQGAFKQLVEQYQDKVFNTAISMVQDNGMAEDITQEVFITVYRSILSFNAQSSVSTWIYRITINKCLDHLRTRNRQKKAGIFQSIFYRDSGEPVHDTPAFGHPGITLESRENAKYLFEAIETLQYNQKTAFILAHVEELPQKDIAEIMNLSVKAVESLLQRAKMNLRKKLSAVYEGKNINERLN